MNTGTTKGTAKRIQKKTNGTLIEIKAKVPYTDADLDWTDEDSRVVKEHESASSPGKSKKRPKISNLKAIKKAVKKADASVVEDGFTVSERDVADAKNDVSAGLLRHWKR